MPKTYRLPAELIELGDEFIAAIECRDKCIKSFFKAKKAIFYQKEATKIKKKFWTLIYELYPTVKEEHGWYYDTDTNLLTKDESELGVDSN